MHVTDQTHALTSTLGDVQDLGALGGPLAGLSFVAGEAVLMAMARSPYPRPGSTQAAILTYFSDNATALRLSVAGQLTSSASLIPFIVSVADLAGRTGWRSRTLQAVIVVGGVSAVATMAASALATTTVTRAALTHEPPDLATIRTLHNVAFLAGGPLHTAALGVLVGTLGLAGLRTGELPRTLAIICLAIAPLGVLSPLSLAANSTLPGWKAFKALVSPPTSPLSVAANPTLLVIPFCRFSALILIGIAGILLSRRRR